MKAAIALLLFGAGLLVDASPVDPTVTASGTLVDRDNVQGPPPVSVDFTARVVKAAALTWAFGSAGGKKTRSEIEKRTGPAPRWPRGQRAGRSDNYYGRQGHWQDDDWFICNDGTAVSVVDFQTQPQMLALRLANREPTLDMQQFPQIGDQQVYNTRQRGQGNRGPSGNAGRPNNQWLHNNLGIETPPRVPQPAFSTLQDEESAFNGADNGGEGAVHGLVLPEYQRNQALVQGRAPDNRPYVEGFENLPTTPQGMQELREDVDYYEDGNSWRFRPAVDQQDQRRRRPRYEATYPPNDQRYRYFGPGGSGHKRDSVNGTIEA